MKKAFCLLTQTATTSAAFSLLAVLIVSGCADQQAPVTVERTAVPDVPIAASLPQLKTALSTTRSPQGDEVETTIEEAREFVKTLAELQAVLRERAATAEATTGK